MNEDTPRERLARLETQFVHIDRNVSEMKIKVDAIHDAITQAKGAKLALIGAASVVSSFATVVVSKLLPFFNGR